MEKIWPYKAEKTDKSSEPACLACLYLVKVSPENGFKLLEFLREKPVYNKEGNCNELLNQAAKKYQDAVQDSKQDIRDSVDLETLNTYLIQVQCIDSFSDGVYAKRS